MELLWGIDRPKQIFAFFLETFFEFFSCLFLGYNIMIGYNLLSSLFTVVNLKFSLVNSLLLFWITAERGWNHCASPLAQHLIDFFFGADRSSLQFTIQWSGIFLRWRIRWSLLPSFRSLIRRLYNAFVVILIRQLAYNRSIRGHHFRALLGKFHIISLRRSLMMLMISRSLRGFTQDIGQKRHQCVRLLIRCCHPRAQISRMQSLWVIPDG